MITLTPDSVAASARLSGSGGQASEDYYSLVHWLRAVGEVSGSAPKTVGISSCSRGAGVSTVAANLATAAAQICDQRVLLLDLHVPRSSGVAYSDSSADLGCTEASVYVAQLCEQVQASRVPNLSLLSVDAPGGPRALNLDAGRVSDLLEALERDFGFIVVDLPIVESSLCFVAAGLLNGVLLVMEAEHTRSETAARAKQRLIDAQATVLGIILNKHRQHIPEWLEARL